MFKYARVPHDPMTTEEASHCLEDFFCKVSHAICELHEKYQLAHLDIRLDNICFNKDYNPVFIDFDRSESTDVYVQRLVNSCMVDELHLTHQNDWIQLGWVIAWVLHPYGSYHDRVFDALPDTLKES